MDLKFLIFIFLFTKCAIAADSSSFTGGEPFFLGSRDSLPGEYPSVVLITGVINTPNDHCLGTIVNSNHIVTAAQCVVNGTFLMNPFWLTVTGGNLNITNFSAFDRFTRNVTHLFVNPTYNPTTHINDIAVLRLGEHLPLPSNAFEPALRTTRVIGAGQNCHFGGWGQTILTTPNVIYAMQRSLDLTTLTLQTCNAAHADRVLAATMFCAQSTSTLCQSSRGGGLYCEDEYGNYEFAGISTFGYPCGQLGAANVPSVFMAVRSYNQWIVQQFTRTIQFRPGTPIAQLT